MNRNKLLTTLALASLSAGAHAVTITVDPAPITRVFDQFNDGVSSVAGLSNMADGGEAGGVSNVTMPAGAFDPQFQFPTPGAPFDPNVYRYLRIQSRGTVAGGSQVFPLPPAAPTVLSYGLGTTFSETQLEFVAPVNGTGLRIDPLGGGTAGTETFSYDYIMLDRFPTIGLGEFDRDGGLDGWTTNAQLAGTVSASTSAFTATTSGVDPIMQRAGLNIDTNVYQFLDIRLAVDPASTSRFEFFWGTNTFPGPVGGQSIAITSELIRDGNFHTYRFDMSDEAAWDGNLNLLRLDLLADGDAAAGRTVSLDYVRLSAAVPEPSGALLVGLAGCSLLLRRRR